MNVWKIKKMIPSIIFLGAPFLLLAYLRIQGNTLLDIFVILLAMCWIYLSIEDILKLSVPSIPLNLISLLTLLLAVLQRQEITSYLIILALIVFIFSLIWAANILTKKSLMGLADFIVISSLAFTLRPDLIGPWLLLASLIPLIALFISKDKKNEKLPFIPYLTVSWMLIFTLN